MTEGDRLALEGLKLVLRCGDEIDRICALAREAERKRIRENAWRELKEKTGGFVLLSFRQWCKSRLGKRAGGNKYEEAKRMYERYVASFCGRRAA